jgi:Protein of unknown function (DUF2628)
VPTYTVHEPHPVAEDTDERATRLVFIKEGFALLAFVIPAVWLLLNRLWLALVLFIVVSVGLVALITSVGGSPAMAAWASFVLNLIFGFEARNIHRGVLARKGYEVIGVVTGRDLEDAERRFLSEWLPEAKASGGGSRPSTTSTQSQTQSRGGSVPAVGLSMAT